MKKSKFLSVYNKYKALEELEITKFTELFKGLLETFPLYSVMDKKEFKNEIKNLYFMKKERFVVDNKIKPEKETELNTLKEGNNNE